MEERYAVSAHDRANVLFSQIHFLHYNKDYGSYEEALTQPVCMIDKSEREN